MTQGPRSLRTQPVTAPRECFSSLLAIILLLGVTIWDCVAPMQQMQAGWCDGVFYGQEFGQEL